MGARGGAAPRSRPVRRRALWNLGPSAFLRSTNAAPPQRKTARDAAHIAGIHITITPGPPIQAKIKSFDERATALVDRTEGGFRRNRFHEIIDVIPALRLLRRLDPEHIH